MVIHLRQLPPVSDHIRRHLLLIKTLCTAQYDKDKRGMVRFHIRDESGIELFIIIFFFCELNGGGIIFAVLFMIAIRHEIILRLAGDEIA